ncbi:unnamed protein product [Hymenolepis diminuta]|uniref:ATP synthase mitochondrial F1 complex assembly factor 2 n=1 Tax=Hymenolepis diminuta TaxID=6216 RepID=A0A0R3SV48_HYMDI|nr:unnamed protein product [Hymenolepis diminuta]
MQLFRFLARRCTNNSQNLKFSTQVDGFSESGYEILLDKSRLRTPGGNVFCVPHEGLALAVAHEWDSQKQNIERFTLALTNICCHVIDNPMERSKEKIVNGIMEFADTDTICYRVETPEELYADQEEKWGPILDVIQTQYNFRPPVTTGFDLASISPKSRELITSHLLSYNRWGLVGIQTCVENLKSLWLTLAMVDGYITSRKAVELSRLEQTFQERRWGSVEWFHEVDAVEMNTRVAAGLLVTLTSHSRRSVKEVSQKTLA